MTESQPAEPVQPRGIGIPPTGSVPIKPSGKARRIRHWMGESNGRSTQRDWPSYPAGRPYETPEADPTADRPARTAARAVTQVYAGPGPGFATPSRPHIWRPGRAARTVVQLTAIPTRPTHISQLRRGEPVRSAVGSPGSLTRRQPGARPRHPRHGPGTELHRWRAGGYRRHRRRPPGQATRSTRSRDVTPAAPKQSPALSPALSAYRSAFCGRRYSSSSLSSPASRARTFERLKKKVTGPNRPSALSDHVRNNVDHVQPETKKIQTQPGCATAKGRRP